MKNRKIMVLTAIVLLVTMATSLFLIQPANARTWNIINHDSDMYSDIFGWGPYDWTFGSTDWQNYNAYHDSSYNLNIVDSWNPASSNYVKEDMYYQGYFWDPNGYVSYGTPFSTCPISVGYQYAQGLEVCVLMRPDNEGGTTGGDEYCNVDIFLMHDNDFPNTNAQWMKIRVSVAHNEQNYAYGMPWDDYGETNLNDLLVLHHYDNFLSTGDFAQFGYTSGVTIDITQMIGLSAIHWGWTQTQLDDVIAHTGVVGIAFGNRIQLYSQHDYAAHQLSSDWDYVRLEYWLDH